MLSVRSRSDCTNQFQIDQFYNLGEVLLNANMPKRKSNSNILKRIVICLENRECPHVIRWENREKMIFSVIFVHKNNPGWNPSDLDLFVKLDELSPKKNYFNRPEYIKECKVRCKSNLKKLCQEGTLIKCEKKYYEKSKFSVSYKIKDPNGIYRKLMTVRGDRENPDQGLSSGDCGYSSCMDNNEAINIPSNCITSVPISGTFFILDSSDTLVQGENILQKLNIYEGNKNLSECGSKHQLVMDADTSMHGSCPDKTFIPDGENVEMSFYSDVQNYGNEEKESKACCSNPNILKETSAEMDTDSFEMSYNLYVTETDNAEYLKPETPNMNDDKDAEPDFLYYCNLEDIKPSIGLMEESSDPFIGYPFMFS